MVITVGETQTGIQNVQSETRKELLTKWLHEDLFAKFQDRIVNIDINTMLTWGDTNHAFKKIGKSLPIMDSIIGATCISMDSIIGATCISKDFILITKNVKDFQDLDIEIINPF